MVTCFSTSSGAWPGNSVITDTWTSVTSGKASMGSDLKAAIPAPINRSRSSDMNSGWWIAKETIFRIIVTAPDHCTIQRYGTEVPLSGDLCVYDADPGVGSSIVGTRWQVAADMGGFRLSADVTGELCWRTGSSSQDCGRF